MWWEKEKMLVTLSQYVFKSLLPKPFTFVVTGFNNLKGKGILKTLKEKEKMLAIIKPLMYHGRCPRYFY